MIALEAVAEISVELGASVKFGVTRDGERGFVPILGGVLRGIDGIDSASAFHGLTAEILPGGGDRQVFLPSGAIDIDARYDARTASGSVIGIHAVGTRRPPTGNEESPYFRVSIRFESADPTLNDLQEFLFIADGVRENSNVRHTVYRVI